MRVRPGPHFLSPGRAGRTSPPARRGGGPKRRAGRPGPRRADAPGHLRVGGAAPRALDDGVAPGRRAGRVDVDRPHPQRQAGPARHRGEEHRRPGGGNAIGKPGPDPAARPAGETGAAGRRRCRRKGWGRTVSRFRNTGYLLFTRRKPDRSPPAVNIVHAGELCRSGSGVNETRCG